MKNEFYGTKVHFIGIGGIGMSAIAEIFYNSGVLVQGSDISKNYNVVRLIDKGIKVFETHDENNVKDCDVVVVSSAIKDSNPELIAANELGKKILHRSQALGVLTNLRSTIAISGAHGKTTTTSLVASLLIGADFDPTVINGGVISSIGSNAKVGNGKYLVIEADESDGSFLNLFPEIIVVTNLDTEHLDYYGNFENIKDYFKKFIAKIPKQGFAVCFGDQDEMIDIVNCCKSDCSILTYGERDNNDAIVKNIRSNQDGSLFDVEFNVDGKKIIVKDLRLPLYGKHNVLNAASVVVIGLKLGISVDDIKLSLASFSGVKRRFTVTGHVNGAKIVDDYAHHPTEIKAILDGAKQAAGESGKVYVVMQPHRYTRLHSLFQDFVNSFDNASEIYITDVYAAGENPIANVNSEVLAGAINGKGKAAHYLDDINKLPDLLGDKLQEGDILMFLGAGSISGWAYEFPKKFSY